MDKFYMANWQYLESDGPADMWFYSSQKNMSNLNQLYKSLISKYLIADSEYIKNAPSQKDILNAIRLYKQFFIDTGLWDKKVLLDSEWE